MFWAQSEVQMGQSCIGVKGTHTREVTINGNTALHKETRRWLACSSRRKMSKTRRRESVRPKKNGIGVGGTTYTKSFKTCFLPWMSLNDAARSTLYNANSGWPSNRNGGVWAGRSFFCSAGQSDFVSHDSAHIERAAQVSSSKCLIDWSLGV